MSAKDYQIGGNHYKDMAISPRDYAKANGLDCDEFSVVKYISRWRSKDGIKDLRKAKHFIEMLIEDEIGPQSE